MEEKSSNLSLASVGLGDEGNYSCAASNHVGTGEEDHLILEVSGNFLYPCFILSPPAPPGFLLELPEKTTLVLGNDVTFECQVG